MTSGRAEPKDNMSDESSINQEADIVDEDQAINIMDQEMQASIDFEKSN